MQHLTLVGLTEDKKKLVLVSDSGEEYTLAADERLRAALRGDLARLGQLEIRMDSALRPRDIQARIRAGETPESVAQAAQTTVDRIMTYASPVLAERAHIADRAQRASVRRKGGEGPARTLWDAVAEQLRAKNVDPESVDWDSWRREDGRWSLHAEYRLAERPKKATFTFDVQGRYVVAEDDEARWLVGEAVTRKAATPRPASSGGAGRRLSAVGPEQELPLGDDAIEMVTGPAEAEEATVDLTPAAKAVRGREAKARPDGLAPSGDADWMATQASDRPQGSPVQAAETAPDEAPHAAAAGTEVPTGEDTGGEQPAAQADAETDAEAEAEAQKDEGPAKRSGRKGRRASVPSWDEIMFGGGRSD